MNKILSLLKSKFGAVNLTKAGNFRVSSLKPYTSADMSKLQELCALNNCTVGTLKPVSEINAIETAKTGQIVEDVKYEKCIIIKPAQQDDDETLLAGFGQSK